jgi:sec-independent protein translocase protein TatB
MNIFSNLGITELVLILLLALLVVGPERLPELGRKLGATLRDLRTAYDNLTKDLGPELASFQETAQELRDSVDSVRSIPQDMVQQVVKSAELDDTLNELKDVRDTVGQMGQTLSDAQKVISNPINAAVDSARGALSPEEPKAEVDSAEDIARVGDAAQEPVGSQDAPEPADQAANPDDVPSGDEADTAVQVTPEAESVPDTGDTLEQVDD